MKWKIKNVWNHQPDENWNNMEGWWRLKFGDESWPKPAPCNLDPVVVHGKSMGSCALCALSLPPKCYGMFQEGGYLMKLKYLGTKKQRWKVVCRGNPRHAKDSSEWQHWRCFQGSTTIPQRWPTITKSQGSFTILGFYGSPVGIGWLNPISMACRFEAVAKIR